MTPLTPRAPAPGFSGFQISPPEAPAPDARAPAGPGDAPRAAPRAAR